MQIQSRPLNRSNKKPHQSFYRERIPLPPGIWAMSWVDFWERYAYKSRRANILSGLMLVIKLLVRSGCQTIYIGGSFITSKERPMIQNEH
jgi:hypothetical protein